MIQLKRKGLGWFLIDAALDVLWFVIIIAIGIGMLVTIFAPEWWTQ